MNAAVNTAAFLYGGCLRDAAAVRGTVGSKCCIGSRITLPAPGSQVSTPALAAMISS
jgi:hypothetical protein